MFWRKEKEATSEYKILDLIDKNSGKLYIKRPYHYGQQDYYAILSRSSSRAELVNEIALLFKADNVIDYHDVSERFIGKIWYIDESTFQILTDEEFEKIKLIEFQKAKEREEKEQVEILDVYNYLESGSILYDITEKQDSNKFLVEVGKKFILNGKYYIQFIYQDILQENKNSEIVEITPNSKSFKENLKDIDELEIKYN